VTVVAAYCEDPLWLAVIVQFPVAIKETTQPVTVQTAGVFEFKRTMPPGAEIPAKEK